MQTIDKPSDATAAALREWFTLDTWMVREGLLLLAGIDPNRAHSLILAGTGWRSDTNPAWAAIGYPPSAEWRGDGPPVERGLRFAPDELMRLHKLTDHWYRRPEHEGMTREAPAYYIAWAQSKGLAPSWLAIALDAGIVPTEPAPAAAPEVKAAGQVKRWTPERLDELKAYRATHTAQDTAAHFDISTARMRELLPSDKPKPTPFPGNVYRAK